MKKEVDNIRHIAIIYNSGGGIVCYGFNYYDCKDKSVHAEHAAINKLRYLINSRKIKEKKNNFTMKVERINRNMETLLSEPCSKCRGEINSCGLFSKVYYSV